MTRPARAVIIAIYPATFHHTPDWPQGPLPLRHGHVHADMTGRSTYYPPRTARLLYGDSHRPRRWHKPLSQHCAGIKILGIEAVRLRNEPSADGLIAIHLDAAEAGPLGTVRALAARHRARIDGFTPGSLLDDHAILKPGLPYTLSFATPSRRQPPRLYRHWRYMRWPSTDQWLWALASRTNGTDYPPDPHNLPGLNASGPEDFTFIDLSADWRALILRDGAAFVGRRPDSGRNDPFFNYAELNVRSIYLDAVLIAMLQHHGISELEEALALAIDHPPATTMAELERHVALFRHELWWQHLTSHGIPNQLLGAYQLQHRLAERFDQAMTEINDFNRLTREHEKRYVNNALVLFTLITVPASIALALLQALGTHSTWIFGSVLASSIALTGALLTTRTARVALRSIRKRLSL